MYMSELAYKGEKESLLQDKVRQTKNIVMYLDFTHRLVMMEVTSARIALAALAAWTSLFILISDSVGSDLPVIQSQNSSR